MVRRAMFRDLFVSLIVYTHMYVYMYIHVWMWEVVSRVSLLGFNVE